ncbi:uncharacterized protein LOC127795445 [Diospyros lotus]|uniref:uncharacterized protein LOC127795445 n=1 Tax=Diospyros lotus TaxID=55363 RepID=UPI002250239C|nr:uncharacterized protein LOC127795445 [Diospyros lotus]
MANLVRRPYLYSKMDKEDPEETRRRRAQFLIYKVLQQADSRRKQPPYVKARICVLKIKVGKRLKRLRKRMLLTVSAAKSSLYKRVVGHLKTWKSLVI